jgi:GR25 family glycosyltransferase involved in LPS biosynthesis
MNISVSEKKKRQCAITMEHIDIWHDIITRNSTLSLILEDDAVFVSNFREKFDRTIYTAIRTGALKIGGLAHCVKDKKHLSPNSNEWFEQDPVIVIGGCMQMFDNDFAKNRRDAPPMLSMHKESASRCTHAYLLTACSAQALVRQISMRKNTFVQSDLLLNIQVSASPTLQSFWLDPPIVHQGNRITDLDGIPSFKRTTY